MTAFSKLSLVCVTGAAGVNLANQMQRANNKLYSPFSFFAAKKAEKKASDDAGSAFETIEVDCSMYGTFGGGCNSFEASNLISSDKAWEELKHDVGYETKTRFCYKNLKAELPVEPQCVERVAPGESCAAFGEAYAGTACQNIGCTGETCQEFYTCLPNVEKAGEGSCQLCCSTVHYQTEGQRNRFCTDHNGERLPSCALDATLDPMYHSDPVIVVIKDGAKVCLTPEERKRGAAVDCGNDITGVMPVDVPEDEEGCIGLNDLHPGIGSLQNVALAKSRVEEIYGELHAELAVRYGACPKADEGEDHHDLKELNESMDETEAHINEGIDAVTGTVNGDVPPPKPEGKREPRAATPTPEAAPVPAPMADPNAAAAAEGGLAAGPDSQQPVTITTEADPASAAADAAASMTPPSLHRVAKTIEEPSSKLVEAKKKAALSKTDIAAKQVASKLG